MSYDTWKTNAPDPGSVESDDRCPWCSAGDGEDCDPDCGCEHCKSSLIQQVLREIDILAGER